MKYYLLISDQKQGPYDKNWIRGAVEDGWVGDQTLCHAAGDLEVGQWKPISEMSELGTWIKAPRVAGETADTRQRVASAAAASEAPIRAEITRRSGWSELLAVVGVLSGAAGVVGCYLSASRDNWLTAWVVLASGLLAAVQAFLSAFLVDVFTDIRWFLKELRDRQHSDV